jgi:hypothetical protein
MTEQERTARRRRSEATEAPETIKVTVAPMFSQAVELTIPSDTTIGDLLEIRGFCSETEARLNGVIEPLDTILENY